MKGALALVLAASVACGRSQPAVEPAAPPGSPPAAFAASFEARAWGPDGKLRFRGLLASRGGDHLRAEIAAPSVSAPLIVVASPAGILATLVSQRLFFLGTAEAPLLNEIAGIPINVSEISRLLTARDAVPPDGCTVSRHAWSLLAGAGRVATDLSLRCAGNGLRLRLGDPKPISRDGASDPFALDPPAGYAEVALKDLVDSLRGSLRSGV